MSIFHIFDKNRRALGRGANVIAIGACSVGCGFPVGWDDYGDAAGDTGGEDDYHPSFFIAECNDYVKCSDTPLNQLGWGARAAMEASGWPGEYKLNSGVHLTHFVDGGILPGLVRMILGPTHGCSRSTQVMRMSGT